MKGWFTVEAARNKVFPVVGSPLVLRADAVIHIILIIDPRYVGMLGYGGAGIAKKVTEETGGRVIEIYCEKSLEKAFDTISEKLRSQ